MRREHQAALSCWRAGSPGAPAERPSPRGTGEHSAPRPPSPRPRLRTRPAAGRRCAQQLTTPESAQRDDSALLVPRPVAMIAVHTVGASQPDGEAARACWRGSGPDRARCRGLFSQRVGGSGRTKALPDRAVEITVCARAPQQHVARSLRTRALKGRGACAEPRLHSHGLECGTSWPLAPAHTRRRRRSQARRRGGAKRGARAQGERKSPARRALVAGTLRPG